MQDLTPLRMTPLRIAVAGAGMVSAHHLRAWTATPGTRVVAICDPEEGRAQARAAEFGVPAVYRDVASMLAAGRGVHVLCQKPLAPTLEEAEGLVREVGGRVRLMVHENWRFRPYYRQVKAWLVEGRLGTVTQARLSVRSSGLLEPPGGGPPPQLVRQPFLATLPRLLVFEVLIHHLDVARWLLGPLAVRGAVTRRVSPRVVGEDVAAVLLDGPGGLPVTVEGSLVAAGFPPLPVDDLDLAGTAGRARFDGERLTLEGAAPSARRYDPVEAYDASFAGAIGHFVQGLRTGTPFETEGRDNLETFRLVEAAYAAAAPGG